MVSYLDQTGLEHTLEKLRNQLYPVGSLYFSTNSTSPATIYGGTWERYGKGRTLVSVDESDTDFTAGKTGGEKTNTHRHWMPMGKENGSQGFSTRTLTEIHMRSGSGNHSTFIEDRFGSDGPWTEQTTYDAIIDIMNPYIAVYVWRRTA